MHKCASRVRTLNIRNFSATPKWDHDVLICGGGVVGATLAADILKQSKGACNVGIIELFPPKPTIRAIEQAPDVRVYALSPNSIQVLQRIGAWKHIEARSHPYNAMQIWEESGPGLLKFSANEMKAQELGRICEDQTIQTAIYQSIADQGHTLTTYYGYSVDDIKIPSNPNNPTGPAIVSIKPKDATLGNMELTARLVVGADGANSSIRRLSGISTWGWGYGQEAVVATIRIGNSDSNNIPKENIENTTAMKDIDMEASTHSQSPPQEQQILDKSKRTQYSNPTAYQKYLPTGPLAVLPLWDNYASIVWSTTVAECKRLKSLSEEQFLLELNQALQTPPDTSKWSVFEKDDGITFPPFIQSILGKTTMHSTGRGPMSQLFGRSPIELLETAKKEVTSVVDTCLSMAQISDPLTYPPVVGAVCGNRVSFPLSFSQAQKYTASRVALVGDAAHSIHPQAGQGLNLGILDATTLAEGIVRTLQTGGDLGNGRVLKEYERERYVRNLGMMTVVDVINTMFKDSARANVKTTTTSSTTSSVTTDTVTDQANHHFHHPNPHQQQHTTHTLPRNLPPAAKVKQFLRSVGMLGIHQLGPIKHHIAKFAMGVDSMKK